jgi:hypothetical protein
MPCLQRLEFTLCVLIAAQSVRGLHAWGLHAAVLVMSLHASKDP